MGGGEWGWDVWCSAAWVVAADGREGEEGEYTAVIENNQATFQIHFLLLLFDFV